MTLISHLEGTADMGVFEARLCASTLMRFISTTRTLSTVYILVLPEKPPSRFLWDNEVEVSSHLLLNLIWLKGSF